MHLDWLMVQTSYRQQAHFDKENTSTPFPTPILKNDFITRYAIDSILKEILLFPVYHAILLRVKELIDP